VLQHIASKKVTLVGAWARASTTRGQACRTPRKTRTPAKLTSARSWCRTGDQCSARWRHSTAWLSGRCSLSAVCPAGGPRSSSTRTHLQGLSPDAPVHGGQVEQKPGAGLLPQRARDNGTILGCRAVALQPSVALLPKACRGKREAAGQATSTIRTSFKSIQAASSSTGSGTAGRRWRSDTPLRCWKSDMLQNRRGLRMGLACQAT
jgi:hypothetical protein